MNFGSRFRPAFLATAGALSFAFAHLIFQLGLLMSNEAGAVRTAGVLAVLGLAIAAVAAALAALVVGANLDRLSEGFKRHLRMGFALGAIASLLNLGLCVFFWSPKLAPLPWLLAAAGAWAVFAWRFWRQSADEQRFSALALSRVGLVALALPWLGAPWVVHGALTHQPRIPESPLPPQGAAVLPGAPKRIVLLTFDALRARSTSVQQSGLGTTPTLEAIASEGAYFSACHAAGDQTVVSIAAVLTGLHPLHIFPRVDNRLGYLSKGSATTLAGFLAPAGYRSHYATMLINPSVFGAGDEFALGKSHARIMADSAFKSQSYLPLGEAASWLVSKTISREAPEAWEQQRLKASRRTLEDARALLKAAPDRTFLWVHLGLPHDQYYSVPAAADDGTSLDPTKAERADLLTFRRGDAEQLQRYERIYEDYVRFGDRELGRFVAGLKADGLWEDTMLVITSDHGEEFTPNFAGHGNASLSEDVTHVPLIVKAPGMKPFRSAAPVSHLDVAPTILGAVYAAPPALEGLPLLSAKVPTDRVTETYGLYYKHVRNRHDMQTYAAYSGTRFKYVLDLATQRERLHDLAADPGATRDVGARHPAVLAKLRQHVRARLSD